MNCMSVMEISDYHHSGLVQSISVEKINETDYYMMKIKLTTGHDITISKRHKKEEVKHYTTIGGIESDIKKIGATSFEVKVAG